MSTVDELAESIFIKNCVNMSTHELTSGFASDVAYKAAEAFIAEREKRKPKEPEWIEHTGNGCPVPPDTMVEFMYANGITMTRTAREPSWVILSGSVLNIKRYRVIT